MFRLYSNSGVCTVQLLKSCHLELHKQDFSMVLDQLFGDCFSRSHSESESSLLSLSLLIMSSFSLVFQIGLDNYYGVSYSLCDCPLRHYECHHVAAALLYGCVFLWNGIAIKMSHRDTCRRLADTNIHTHTQT